ncbi:alpha/beta-hydrolase [Cylindrobasidium torrendii FP15055 ss-10]|uniref:Carboxylic ester hydrolase n=1 Tax=Cylindrobasidium torrendii FP15055 ss-10 TaxID=1314674 RepID=A0A0D7B624_9AGAR|nr:alpha/beta-hydrolase [Cylindrobasidium torrendii FP15055 ss-10]
MLRFSFVFAALARGVLSIDSPLGPVVDLGYVAYAGNSTTPTGNVNGSVVFYGNISYAQSPTGERRFRAPAQLDEAPLNEVTVLDARGWGPACIQRPAVVGVGSEDCLTLNVWKPSNATETSLLPVAVYIHGGGFYAKTPQGFPLYSWVDQNQGIVGVSITYRLGIFGFLGGDEVYQDGDLNAGLLDQRAGLEWVQRHISKFGGDPNQVTIYGESAGGASVIMQMAAYGGAQGVPFQRAVAQSIGFGPTRLQAEVEEAFVNVTRVAGCPSKGAESMACLRNAPLQALADAQNNLSTKQPSHFAPVIEPAGGFLTNYPSRMFAAGEFTPVPLVVGHTTHDGRTFAGGKPEDFVTEQDVIDLVFSRWPAVAASNETVALAMNEYPSPDLAGSPFEDQYERAWTMAGEMVFACLGLKVAQSVRDAGVEDIHAFRWNTPNTPKYNAAPYQGVMHTSDIYFLFEGTNTIANAGNVFTPFNTSEALLAHEAVAYWASIAQSGDPNTAKLGSSPVWEGWQNPDGFQRIVITRGNDTQTLTAMEEYPADEIERCAFWMQDVIVDKIRV